MKLLLCVKCSDIVRLELKKFKSCTCGLSGGLYNDSLNATVWGPKDKTFVLGFANGSLIKALREQIERGDSKETMIYGSETVTKGRDFRAFIIPESATSITRYYGDWRSDDKFKHMMEHLNE
jgi:hypothetical protein